MNRSIMSWALVLGLVFCTGRSLPARQAAASGVGQQESKSSGQSQTSGTGIVPPGVTLSPQMPSAGAPRPFEFPTAATKTLANGLRVFVVTDHREPAVAANLVILSAGSVEDPRGAPGVAQLTASLLTQGTAKRTARDIAEGIDFVGGTLSAKAEKDSTTVSLDVVRKDLGTGLDLMSDVVLHPAFLPEEIERQRQQLLSALTVEYSDPDYLATVAFARTVFGDSPYGVPAEGTPDVVKKLQRDDFVKFHDANYAPNRSILAFAGDITPEEAFAAAEKYFGGWPKQNVSSPEPSPPSAAAGQRIWLIDKPDAVQTQIRIGRLGIRRSDPDYIPLLVTNRIFGGGYNSRLNTEVRIKKGLTYGAYSTFSPHRTTGAFVVGTFTRTEATVEAAKLVVDLISKMSAGQVTQQELDFARDYLAGVYPIQSETSEQVADRVVTVAAYDLPSDYNRTYQEKVRAISAANVQAVGQKYFTTSDLDMVFAGNVSAFRDALKKEFPNAQFREISLDQIDVLSPDLRKPKDAAAAATPESIEQER